MSKHIKVVVLIVALLLLGSTIAYAGTGYEYCIVHRDR